MRITVLSRGGLGVYGGVYDPHTDEAILTTRDGEIATVTLEYASAPTSPTISLDGAAASAPTISGRKVSLTVSGVQGGARIDVTAIVGGETKLVRIRGKSPRQTDRYESVDQLV